MPEWTLLCLGWASWAIPVASEAGNATRSLPPPAPRIVTPVLTELAKLGGLVDPQGDEGDQFGYTLATDGNTMAVGTPADDTLSAPGEGSVTIFVHANGVWTSQQRLFPEPGDSRNFGRSLALEGDLLVVGASSDSGGAAYVFRRSGTWSLEQKLVAGATGSDFGASVATSGGTVLVGAPGAQGAGAVSVFVPSADVWIMQQRLLPPAATGDTARFGAALDLAGDVAAIGAPGVPGAYVFRRKGLSWTLSQQIPGTVNGEALGTAIAMDGHDLAIGSPKDPYGFDGAAYVFRDEENESYSLIQRVTCPSTAGNVRCGAFVALSGDMLLVGAPLYGDAGGSVSLFAQSGDFWNLRQELLPSDAPSRAYGTTAALAGSQVLVGAPHADTAATDSGAVYVFGPVTSDLTLGMSTSPLETSQGSLVTVSLTLTNRGTTALVGAGVTVSLEPGLIFYPDRFSPHNGTCVAAAGGAICTFDTVSPGLTGSADFLAVAAAAGTFNSSATVPGGPSAQATTTILPASADVAVTLTTAPTTVRRGGTLQYTFSVTNNGPAPAAAVRLVFTTPPGLVLKTVGGGSCVSLPCTMPRNGGWVWATYEVSLDYSYRDPIPSWVAVTAANDDPVPNNNVRTANTFLDVDTTNLMFYTVPPCRLVDTRDQSLGGPEPLRSGYWAYIAGGHCGIPFTARAIAINVTATQPTTAGYLNVYPLGPPPPPTSFVNYRAWQTRSNNGVVGLDSLTRFGTYVDQWIGTVHVIVDVVGYFE